MPANALRFNEQTIYDLDLIVPRIKLIGITINFIHRCCTELIYRNQYTHQTAAREAGVAVLVALNPFNTAGDFIAAKESLEDYNVCYATYTGGARELQEIASEDGTEIIRDELYRNGTANVFE
ncbi:MAG: hypothetical protein PT956_02590 [Firmicutes bacterium]|nr:hypothetical protein [Bacillota bacterium]